MALRLKKETDSKVVQLTVKMGECEVVTGPVEFGALVVPAEQPDKATAPVAQGIDDIRRSGLPHRDFMAGGTQESAEGKSRITPDSRERPAGGSAERALRTLPEVFKAIEAVHARSLRHREITPDDILLTLNARAVSGPDAAYAGETARLESQQHADQAALAAALTPILNRRLRSMASFSIADKQTLAKWVNAELRRFGLAILCPKTGRPSALIADSSGAEGRFQLLNETPEGRKVRSLSSKTLPTLKLIPASTVKESVESINNSIHIDGLLTIEESETPVSEGTPEPKPAKPTPNVAGLFEGLPDDFEGRTAALTAVNAAFRQELANQLAPALNAKAQAMPHGTYEEKKTVAKWINAELRKFDLAIKCPKTGLPATMATGPGNHPEIGRFQLLTKDKDGKQHRPVSSPDLFEFELMEAPPRHEGLKNWQDRVSQQGSGASRSERDSQDVEGQKAALLEANAASRQAVADELALVLNAKAQAMPHETYEEKKALARWVNEELRQFDLAVKCPKTGEPSLLLVMQGHQPGTGRFVIEHKSQEGKRLRSFTSMNLPELDLIEAAPRREAIKEWRERVQEDRGGASRA